MSKVPVSSSPNPPGLSCSLFSSDLTRMTDSERDQIDQDAQIFMRTCSEAIRQLRNESASALNCAANLLSWRVCVSVLVSAAEKQLALAQIKEHRVAVLDLIEMYLKGESTEVIHHTSVDSPSSTCV